MTYANVENRTICGVQLSMLVCPTVLVGGKALSETARGPH
jgi:hypothetical protein